LQILRFDISFDRFSYNHFIYISLLPLSVQARICGDPSSNCPHAPGPICGCPDCCKHVPPHIKHGYCKSNPCSSSGGSDGESDSDSDSDAEAAGSGKNASFEDQEPTRRSTLWIYLAGAGALAGMGAAWAMRRRMVAAAASKKGLADEEEEVEMSSNKGLSEFDDEMGGSYAGGSFAAAAQAASSSVRNLGLLVGGAAAAAAGAVGIAALSRRSNSDESETGDAMTGSVSRRYGMMADGNGSVGSPYDDSGARPEFIEVAPRSYYAAPAVISTSARGIEVEGPMRPSSQYTI
jgi:hypothetical protein